MTAPDPSDTRVRHTEDFDAQIDQILALARERGEAIRRRNKGVYRRVKTPNISDLLRDELRQILEDEIVPATAEVPVRAIMDWEYHQELIKKALVGLKLPALRDIARSQQLVATGGREALATEIGRYYHWDDEEIARLILENEEEPPTERGWTDRMFPVRDISRFQYITDRMGYVLNRYIRIGIARWFVFDRVEVQDENLVVAGTVRSYQARVIVDEENNPELNAIPSEHAATALVSAEDNIVRIRNASAADARGLVRAIELAARIEPLGYVPMRGQANGSTVGFDRTALFMLDLLAHRLPASGLRNLDLTVARFKVGEERDEDEGPARPTLKAVRFEGRYLLDSAPACKLLAEESRALVDVSLRVSSPPRADGEAGRFPVRIANEGDHMLVTTGYGGDHPELFPIVHRALLGAVEDEMKHGFVSVERLQELCNRIRLRAQAIAPDQVDLLGDLVSDMRQAQE